MKITPLSLVVRYKKMNTNNKEIEIIKSYMAYAYNPTQSEPVIERWLDKEISNIYLDEALKYAKTHNVPIKAFKSMLIEYAGLVCDSENKKKVLSTLKKIKEFSYTFEPAPEPTTTDTFCP